MEPFDPKHLAQAIAAASQSATVTALDLGRRDFEPMAAAQAAYLELRRHSPAAAHDVLLFLEHEPVYTMSRRAKPQHLVWTAEERERRGVRVAEVDRGGDVTYHGPGQIVAYPLLELAPLRLGTSAYMAGLEQVVNATLAELGIEAFLEPGMPGVWVADPRRAGASAKICAIGTRVSRGLTKHGFALNHTLDLTYMQGIVPCGLPLPVTSLAELGGQASAVSRQTLLAMLARHFEQVFQVRVTWQDELP